MQSETIEEMLLNEMQDSFIEDGQIIGYFDDHDKCNTFIQNLRNKGYSYSIRDSDSRTKQRRQSENNDSSDLNRIAILYQLKAMSIKFFGMPFTIEKTTHFHCVYGRKYYKSRSSTEESKGKRNGMSKKMGCLAKMTLKKIAVYPDYKIEVESDWRKKKKQIERLRNDLSDPEKQVNIFFRYYLSISVFSSHNHLPTFITPNNPVQKTKQKTSKIKLETPKKSIIEGAWENSMKVEIPDQEPPTLAIGDVNFLKTFVRLSDDKTDVTVSELTEPAAFEIQAVQFQATIEDLQNLFREKLKSLYHMSESCVNSSLLFQLIGDLEQIELQMSNDVGFDKAAPGSE